MNNNIYEELLFILFIILIKYNDKNKKVFLIIFTIILIYNDMSCTDKYIVIDEIQKPYFVWYEDNWVHDNIVHRHEKGQLVYVDSGFQYLTIEEKTYLLPQNHAAWIPSKALHKTNTHSDKIKLMILFFDVSSEESFYNNVQIFSVPPLLKEMIRYAEKWSLQEKENSNESVFLHAMLNELPQLVEQSLHLHITLPEDLRLKKAIDYLHSHYTDKLKLDTLSEISSVSLRTLERIFKKETGLTINKYQQILRIIKSLELLSENELTVSEIAFKVGYKSLQAFTNSFYTIMKKRPTYFLKENI